MVSHVALMTPRADLSATDKRAFIDAFERALRDIPTIRGVRVGRRVRHGAEYEQSQADVQFVAIIDFDDLAGLQTYLRHPAHEDVGARFGQSLSFSNVYDFEVGGKEALESLG